MMFKKTIKPSRTITFKYAPSEPSCHSESATYDMKRLGDLAIACVFLAITLPLLLVVSFAIKWASPGPTLEAQERIGQSGRRFRMLAFRTTVQHNPLHSTPLAPETTGVGSFLRYTRIDALPQLINVLRGDISMLEMSLFD
jgi:lipopolysaccharide/colanic/teichoic acid biosynthesis glycosyltransferase